MALTEKDKCHFSFLQVKDSAHPILFKGFSHHKEEKPSLHLVSSLKILKIPGQDSILQHFFLFFSFFLPVPCGNSRKNPGIHFPGGAIAPESIFPSFFPAPSGRKNSDRQNGVNGRHGEKRSENLKHKNQKRRKIRILPPAVSRREQSLSLPDRGVNSFSSNAALR